MFSSFRRYFYFLSEFFRISMRRNAKKDVVEGSFFDGNFFKKDYFLSLFLAHFNENKKYNKAIKLVSIFKIIKIENVCVR